MKSKIFSHYLHFVFLSAILSLSANDQNEIQIHISEVELQEIFNNPDRSYVYVGNEVSNIADVIAEISKLDDNKDSFIWGLVNHIGKGFVIGNYEAVAQALEQAELLLRNKSSLLDADKARDLFQSLNNIIEQVIEEKLTIDAESLAFLRDRVGGLKDNVQRSGLRLLVINEKMYVLGKAKFKKDVIFKDHVKFEHFVKFDGNVKFGDNATFEQNITIAGTLSAADEIIGCDLTVGCNISISDSVSPAIGNIIKNGVPFIHNYPGVAGNNTFAGYNAGNFILTGIDNTGFGANALVGNMAGSDNTAVGYNALPANTDDQMTAVGSGAMQNFVNGNGGQNVAVGYNAVNQNTVGNSLTAVGWSALALDVTTTTGNNTAVGWAALSSNTTGVDNTAIGNDTLTANTSGLSNVALGSHVLNANISGNNNIAIGYNAGNALITGSNNIYIGADAVAADESNVTRIGNIYSTTTGSVTTLPVIVDNTGQLGTMASTRRVKHDIQDMNADSADIYNLRPVTFVYNGDASETKQYGLIAEEADEVFPTIVVHDENNQPYTVQYHVLPALILNELQKLAARVAVLEARS